MLNAIERRLVRQLVDSLAQSEERGRALSSALHACREDATRERRQRQWLESVIDEMPEGVVLANARGLVTSRNKALTMMASPEGGLDIRRVSGEGLPVEELPSTEALATDHPAPARELRLRTHSGSVVPVLVSAVPIHGSGGEVAGTAMFVRDITAGRKRDDDRESWAAMVAHDLRQPVTAIALAVAVLRKGLVRSDANLEQRTYERIQGLAARLSTMINDLLDASAIESGHLSVSLRPARVREVVESVVGAASDIATRLELTLDQSADEPVLLDPTRISQVLENLLTNATKYAEPASPISVSSALVESHVRVTVRNRGGALSPADLERIFQRYERRHPGGPAGLGLGLFICRGIVEAHGGRIWAECGDGATGVHFTIPRATDARSPRTPPPEQGIST